MNERLRSTCCINFLCSQEISNTHTHSTIFIIPNAHAVSTDITMEYYFVHIHNCYTKCTCTGVINSII